MFNIRSWTAVGLLMVR